MFRIQNCFTCSKNVKWSRYRPGVAQRVGRGIALLFMTAALEGGEWSATRPGRTLHSGKTRYPFYRRLGGPQGRSGRAENLVPAGIRSRTVQPVVSHYTDWAIRPVLHVVPIWLPFVCVECYLRSIRTVCKCPALASKFPQYRAGYLQ